ncbi:MAG: class I SAM-dependent methyltransferase [Flavobacteriaceae bacterium]|nr:class I SAM-dependent methyltransferase [Flavobacteriaceae bacterium]
MNKETNNDIIGNALLDYQLGNFSENIITYSSIAGNDQMDVPFLFRSFDEMPIIEQKAMQLCHGNVLDIGCGAGSHALYLQNKNLKVKAIDISKGAIKTCIFRGVKNATIQNIWNVKNEKFDTILALMNGIGVCEKLENLTAFLLHLKLLLNPNGQILLDSSDVIYMYEEQNRETLLQKNEKYYGEVAFEMIYKNKFSKLIHWLFVDFNTLQSHAKNVGLTCDLIKEGYHHDFLVKLSLNKN